MKAQDIYHKMRAIAEDYHAYTDQLTAIAMWIEAEFEYKPQKLANSANASEGQLTIPDVSTRTFRFADWVNGKHIDETFKAVNRDDAIRIMNEKYPNHEFALAQELF